MQTIYAILEYIVPKTIELNNKYISDEIVEINYSAIFCQNQEEWENFNNQMASLATIIDNTPTGPLYKFNEPVKTMAGNLLLLKIRKYDKDHPQRGDADFTIKNYELFKNKYLKDINHFNIIKKPNFEMIELKDPNFDVMSYFSSIPLIIQYGLS